MENIFYAALALHVAGKPVNKENIRAVLKAAGTPVNEAALDAMTVLVEALETGSNKKSLDTRVIRFLTSELVHRNVEAGQVEDLLTQLARYSSSTAPVGEAMPAALVGATSLNELSGDEEMFAELGDGRSRYIYGVAAGGETIEFGRIGIEDNQVYSIPYKDICAIVHSCPSEPYQSRDGEVVKAWVKAHQQVVEAAKERLGAVIPLSFDTIVRPGSGTAHPDQVVRDWLKEDYDSLFAIMERIQGRDEYGVQVFYDPKVIDARIFEQSELVRQIQQEMANKSPGMAYMYRQKLEKAVRSEREKLVDQLFQDFYARMKRHSDDTVIGKTRKGGKETVMLLNVYCLAAEEKVESLGEELEEIDNMEGFSVRFSGPWPPYSFVAKTLAPVKGK
jgi:hypothetical protein